MKAKLTKEGLILVSESDVEDAEVKALYNKGLMLIGKAVGVNKQGRKEGLFQNRMVYNVTTQQTMAEKPHSESELLKMVKEELYDRHETIDGFSDKGGHDWDGLIQGWAIAKGLTPEEASNFAQVCHRTDFDISDGIQN